MTKTLGILIASVCISISHCNPKTLEQIQYLHKDIGGDLMSIRKEFTAAQPKIYSILDRLDKMYNLAKTEVEKSDEIKTELDNKLYENKRLQDELAMLRTKLQSTEKALDHSIKKITDVNKELQVEKIQTAILSREKKELDQEKNVLRSQMSGLHTNNDKSDIDKKESVAENILKQLTEEEKHILKTSQNLSLSSTSAPNSPR
jgi:phosphoglycerate-specific signal transduction histidine kinase